MSNYADPALSHASRDRLAVDGPGSLTGRYPVGNTGGAGISLRAVLPLPDDLGTLLRTTT